MTKPEQLPSGWIKSTWISKYKKVKLYKVKLYNESEEFIKIGITASSIPRRMSRIPYKYKIIRVIEGTTENIIDLEDKLLNLHKKSNYKPQIKFRGSTECFKI